MVVDYVDLPKVGRAHLLEGPVTHDDEQRLRDEHCSRLVVNRLNGGSQPLDFLGKLPNLEELFLSDLTVDDIAGVERAGGLRVLHLNTYDQTAVNFSMFRKLENCLSFWRPGIESLFERVTLKHLEVHRYREPDLQALRSLKRLESLTLVDSPSLESLAGLDALSSLRSLRIESARKLADVRPLTSAGPQLEVVELGQCKGIQDPSPLGAVASLRELVLDNMGNLSSIMFVSECTRLEILVLSGNTNVEDGDLSVVLSLPALQRALIKDRRHYSHSKRQLNEALAERNRRHGVDSSP